MEEKEIEKRILEERKKYMDGPWWSEETEGQYFDLYIEPKLKDALQRGFPDLPREELFQILEDNDFLVSFDIEARHELLKKKLSNEELVKLLPFSEYKIRREIIERLLGQSPENQQLREALRFAGFPAEGLEDLEEKIKKILAEN